eukprot:6430986-Amphidinium_carterae.1
MSLCSAGGGLHRLSFYMDDPLLTVAITETTVARRQLSLNPSASPSQGSASPVTPPPPPKGWPCNHSQ